ncbi:helix-turn-helix transcriptional regulator [Phytomonospora sp. NPDC050363]|uniref:helix-turn-helix domain-containing protein n=1 Tax=Phytomonospora sp. NPDC050363 TaxID=3155642 RepID=UPI00340BFE6F
MGKNQALSLRSQWLGERLRAARARLGYTLRDVAEYVGLDFTTIGRFERGTQIIRPAYVRDLIAFYGISDELERDRLLRLNEDAWRKDWWNGDTSDLDVGFIDYTWLEARAERIWLFESTLFSGLLQTAEYTRAVTVAGLPGANEETIERMVELRLTRQRILTGEAPTHLSMVVEEHALHRPIGGVGVQRRQLQHLLNRAEEPNIDVRILLPEVGWHFGNAGPFIIFGMPDPYPDVVYLEGIVGRTFLEEEETVDTCKRGYDDLHRASLSPEKSRELIAAVLKGLT